MTLSVSTLQDLLTIFYVLVFPSKYMLKEINKSAGKMYEIFSKLTTNTPERCHWRRSGVFIVNFKHIYTFF